MFQAEVETRPPLEKDLALGLSEGHLERINSALSDSSVTGGKVRAVLPGARCPRSKSHGATARGWDKSFPLEPLKKGVKAKTIPLHTPILNLDEINSNLRLKDKFSFNKSPGLNGDTQGLSNINTVIFTKLPNIGGPLISEKKPDNRIGEEFNAQSGITTNKGEMSPTKDVSAITRGISRLPVSPKRKIEPPKPIGGLTKVASTEEKKPQAPPQAPGRRVPRPNITTTTLSPPKTVTTAKPTIPVIKSLKPPAVKPAPLKPKAPARAGAGAGVGAKAAPKDEDSDGLRPEEPPGAPRPGAVPHLLPELRARPHRRPQEGLPEDDQEEAQGLRPRQAAARGHRGRPVLDQEGRQGPHTTGAEKIQLESKARGIHKQHKSGQISARTCGEGWKIV
ncbi:uncharacterized protein [Bemisia tabaci]|uniref:uncharacterized protein n=1 Tax=Bemisia tabaci TaxID=7038 RepID=UPI003B27B3C8